MTQVEQLGQAGLIGWRAKVAERVAPAAARRAPLSEDQARAIVGALFFALSAYYVISTTVRMARAGRDRVTTRAELMPAEAEPGSHRP